MDYGASVTWFLLGAVAGVVLHRLRVVYLPHSLRHWLAALGRRASAGGVQALPDRLNTLDGVSPAIRAMSLAQSYEALFDSFGEYHSSIVRQRQLLDQVVTATWQLADRSRDAGDDPGDLLLITGLVGQSGRGEIERSSAGHAASPSPCDQ